MPRSPAREVHDAHDVTGLRSMDHLAIADVHGHMPEVVVEEEHVAGQ
jgi:hypothetical protein